MALMNPKDEDEEEEEEVSRMQTDVTDEEMALRYRNEGLLTGTLSPGPFKTRSHFVPLQVREFDREHKEEVCEEAGQDGDGGGGR